MLQLEFTTDLLELGTEIINKGERYFVNRIQISKNYYIDRPTVENKKIFVSLLDKQKNDIENTKELWRNVKGFKYIYEVSNLGKVRNFSTKKELKLIEQKSRSNVRVALRKKGKTKRYSVHKLVAEAFIDNPYNYKYVIRKDGDYKNNQADNLMWTNSLRDTFRSKNIMASASNPGINPEIKKIINNDLDIFDNIESASSMLNIPASSISRVLAGLQKTAGGYYWEYINE